MKSLLLQSVNKKNHRTKTALLKVTNNILMKKNSQHAVLLVLLELSTAIDTVDHSPLLQSLPTSFTILGAPLDDSRHTVKPRKHQH